MIAAVDRNYAIGYKNKLLVKIQNDMDRFRELTRGRPVIMGRKTAESLPKPLEGRRNVLITREEGYSLNGFDIAHSVTQALLLCKEADETFVIGGGELYKQMISMASTVYLTHIDMEYIADAFFPVSFPQAGWELKYIEPHQANDDVPGYKFARYDRKGF